MTGSPFCHCTFGHGRARAEDGDLARDDALVLGDNVQHLQGLALVLVELLSRNLKRMACSLGRTLPTYAEETTPWCL